GTNISSNTAGPVLGLSSVHLLRARGGRTCVVLFNGLVKCWGENTYGQLGDGTTIDRNVPTNVIGVTGSIAISAGVVHTCAGLAGATALSVGGGHACSVVAGGAVKCWGLNDVGQLGDGTFTDTNAPGDVLPGITGAISVDLAGSHSCALFAAGTVKCWGWNVV